MDLLATTALCCTLGFASAAPAKTSALAGSVRACMTDEAVACDRLAERLETLFAGSRNGGDRAPAHELAAAAVKALRDDAAPRIVVEPVTRCAANDGDACERIAQVLAGLFTGSDAQLDASRDRALARAFVVRVISEVRQ
jgi:hypothetical protein